MTRLFVPGASPGAQTRQAHDELRRYAEARTGRSTRPTGVYAVNCRRDGADSATRVGERDPCGGEIVRAIFATSHGHTIVWRGGLIEVSKRQTYDAIEFD